ncbi:MAG: 50S ribosomal protein L24 [Candidatus Komeilibacteria bacterium]|nr:50S ribosomal protein L24 [Candidatus Komeilibacteria bacterium]
MKIKKGDTVKIIAGKDNGKTGKITQVFTTLNKVVVEGLNIHFRNLKPRRQGEKGQRIEYSSPINVSNVMLLDPRTAQATRIGFKTLESGEKVRISKKSGEVI